MEENPEKTDDRDHHAGLAQVFDASHLESIIGELAAQAVPLSHGREAEDLKGLTAVDGSVFAGMSRMAWALWNGPENRGACPDREVVRRV